MRDFSPETMQKRTYIFEAIRKVFEKYGFQALETPAMESLSTLTGKYGEEGDQLLYKILNSGDFLHKRGNPVLNASDLEKGVKAVAPKLSEKGLRYDLTVPFARYVAGNYNELPIPFKRYQIQPVWRADRPQKGRYREFYQCDADAIGTDSLLCEAEIFMMIEEVFKKLNIPDYHILVNNRKLLDQIAKRIGSTNSTAFFTVLDKLDKLGENAVIEEFKKMSYSESQLSQIKDLMSINGRNNEILDSTSSFLDQADSEGLEELREVLQLFKKLGGKSELIKVQPTLARGLGYYTGTILEVKVNNVEIGSVAGGGRYDDLTGIFGLPNVSGVGFSFGVDRLYDVMEEQELFPDKISKTTNVLIVHFDKKGFEKGLEILEQLRGADIAAELFPDTGKLKKQLQYANKKNIPFSIIIGDEELAQKKWQLRNMDSGQQQLLSTEKIIEKLK